MTRRTRQLLVIDTLIAVVLAILLYLVGGLLLQSGTDERPTSTSPQETKPVESTTTITLDLGVDDYQLCMEEITEDIYESGGLSDQELSERQAKCQEIGLVADAP